jgi:tetratricopeptide (TPR) repeat protein
LETARGFDSRRLHEPPVQAVFGHPPGQRSTAFAELVEPTRSATDEGLPLALRLGVLPAYFELLAIRGFLELSLGSAAEAHRFLGPLPQAVREAGFGEPLFRFHGDAIETLLALGQTDEATALVVELEEQVRALQRVWALAVASRCRALLSAAAGEIERAYDELDRTLELHDQLGEPFERARTLLVLGTIQRRARKKRAARESLERALAVFEELGAVLWSERARAELARIGGRAPSPGALTPTEKRVATLIAAGRTYREVADALFVSPRRCSGTSRRSTKSSAFAHGGSSPPSSPPKAARRENPRLAAAVKVQRFRRFPSSSSRANTGDSADFRETPSGVPSIR